MNIDAIHSEGLAFERPELDLDELPPIPEDFQKELEELGGHCNGYPNVRIVSGLDPSIVEFYGGRFWRKYAFREHRRKEYYTYHTPDGEKKILTIAEAEVYSKSSKLKGKGVLVPVIEHDIIEHGIPRYFVELYKPPIAFGDPQDWEVNRYMKPDDQFNFTGEYIDMLGDFPVNGMYETWFAIEEPVEDETGKVVSTQFRAIDDTTKEFIRFMVNRIKEQSAVESHRQLVEENAETYQSNMEEMRENIRYRLKEREHRLFQTPRSYGTGKDYERNSSETKES